MLDLLRTIGQTDAFRAFEDFMSNYGMYIAALGVGFLACMCWWAKSHPEDFEDADEIECEAETAQEIMERSK